MARPAKVRRKVYTFILLYKQEHDGNPPCYEEIAREFGWALSTAWTHVQGLARDGLVTFDERERIMAHGEYIAPDFHT
jgi:biotin operon repressor